MIKNIELEKGAYQFDAKMPLRQAIPLGLQHVFAMFVGNLTPLLIITSACGLAGGEFADLQVSLLQNASNVTSPIHPEPRITTVSPVPTAPCSAVWIKLWN